MHDENKPPETVSPVPEEQGEELDDAPASPFEYDIRDTVEGREA
jgi:hypothetical protein